MDLVTLIVSAMVGLLGGAVSGVLAAQLIGEKTAAGQRRYAAKTAIRGVVGRYKDELQTEHEKLDKRPESSQGLDRGLSAAYGNAEGQRGLVVSVLRELPYLRRYSRRVIRTRLICLVGTDMVNRIEAAPSLHSPDVTPEQVMSSALLDMLRESKGEQLRNDGTLSRLRGDGESDNGPFEESIKSLSRILDEVQP